MANAIFLKSSIARNIFDKQPNLCQIDDDGLVWCFYEEENLWFSLKGNYSQFSPEEKTQKKIENEERQEKLKDRYEEEAIKRVADILYWSSIRKSVLERDNYQCQLCSLSANSMLHIHHIEKRVNGGSDFLDNLITVCPKCHSRADRADYNPEWIKKEQ